MEMLLKGLWVGVLIACGAAAPVPEAKLVEMEDQEGKHWNHYLASFFGKQLNIALVAGGGALLLVLIAIIITAIGCCCCYRRRTCCFRRGGYVLERRPLLTTYHSPDACYSNGAGQVEVQSGRGPGQRHEKTVAEELRRQREQQEHNDRAHAKKIVLYFLRNEKILELIEELPDMGSRMLKFWFKIREQGSNEWLLTIAPVSQKCPLVLDDKTMATMNKLLQQLSHPQLHPVHTVSYIMKDHMVIIVQSFKRRGSLKDAIYKSTPTSEWTMKYSRRSKGLSADKVALYGRQILEGLRYLYGQGFPPLGHIQTGNVFVDGDFCQLGGYENTLLGYKTRSYKMCKEHMEHVDVILFGHVIFEMACGYELTGVDPGEQQYRDVKDPKVRDILEYIFQSQDGQFIATIEEIYEQPFFQSVRMPIQKGARSDHTHLSGDMKALLAKVTKNKPRTQKVAKEKKKSKSKPSQDQSAAAKPKVGVSGSKDADTAAVLDSIRGERPHLKKTQTDDRSAPKLNL